jgi:hypothetical protein
MKKTTRKMKLSRETLRLLDHSDLSGAEGGVRPPGASFDPTCATRCYICPEPWTRTIGGETIIND